MKKKLSEILGEKYVLKTVSEAISELNWETEFEENDERGTGEIMCACGTKVEMIGFLYPDYLYCPTCNKGTMDVTGMRYNNAYISYVDPDLYEYPEDNRVWVVS